LFKAFLNSFSDWFTASVNTLSKGPDVGIQLLLKLPRGIGDPPRESYYGLMCVSVALALAAAAFA